jgi:aryl-alcohol dehydrogenase-like predicted oxidoreductase
MIFDRLAIGTAAWGKEYNGAKVSEDDQKRILDYCQSSGINTIETATAYEWDWTKISSYFEVCVKINKNDSNTRIKEIVATNPLFVMAHSVDVLPNLSKLALLWADKPEGRPIGVSVYGPKDLQAAKRHTDEILDAYRGGKNIPKCPISCIEMPYSIYDRRCEKLPHMGACGELVWVRSIFLRGKLLKKFSPQECISFCLMNPRVDKVIIGVDSYEQLKDNLRPFHRMVSAEVHDLNIIDPRKWK